jgi:DNA-binding NarL/FixJ family response regulator
LILDILKNQMNTCAASTIELAKIRILIADDHALMREGVKQLIALSCDVVVVAEAENGEQVMKLLPSDGIDLILLDMTMPGVSGVDLISWIRVHAPALPILVLSMHNEPRVIKRALQAGAAGYLTKDNTPRLLMMGIRKVAAGGHVIDPQVAEQMAFQGSVVGQSPPHAKLTERELHILRLLACGTSINQIAVELRISNKTVSSHKAHLMKKMDIQSNAELVRYAVTHGLVE